MKLKLKNSSFAKNIGFYSKITRKCLVCESSKIQSDKFGISCENCGSYLEFEENGCNV